MEELYVQTGEQPAKTSWEFVLEGNAPYDEYELGELSEGIDFISEFWAKTYLDEYIKYGGSKMKFITGRRGSGKTHLMNMMSVLAKNKSYRIVRFSANDIWLHDFKEIYLEIARQCDIIQCLSECAERIVKNMGYDPGDIREDEKFVDYLARVGESNPITKREIRNQLKEMFWENPHMDNNFALACSHLTGALLGHPALEQQNQDLLLGWLYGDKTVRLLLLRALGLSPVRITKYNARHMLRSLAEVINKGGRSGLFVTIDDMEVLADRSSLQPMRYTKMRREDTYESIRQLIDEIDNMNNIMFLFGFDRELIDNDSFGLKSYQALWMRIQNEVVGERYNRFADIVDLDRAGKELYPPEGIVRMSEKLMRMARERGKEAVPMTRARAEEFLQKSRISNIGIPLMVNKETLYGTPGGEQNV